MWKVNFELRRILFVNLLVFCSLTSSAQDYQWWNDIHNWDGTTHWTQYLILSPAYLGPNALPVPEFRTGRINDTEIAEVTAGQHFGEGDHTTDLFTRVNFPLFTDRAILSFSMVPLEYYNMSTATRDLRRARDFDAEGYSVGDLYISTFIQLLENRENLPDLALAISLRTASGNRLDAARFTDTPGYYFDLSAGKDFGVGRHSSIRPFVVFGFYAWQTNRVDYLQNDAVMYAAGLEYRQQNFNWKSAIGGYSGYIGNGDKPVVLRLEMRTAFNTSLNYLLHFQQGLRDFPYSSIRAGVVLSRMK